MTAVFVYGTLRHLPLFETVLGHAAPTLRRSTAKLQGYRVRLVRGQAFPMIFPAPDEAAEGQLLQGLSESDIARLDYYEQVFGYALRPVEVETDSGMVEALFWWPPEETYDPGDAFDLSQWAGKWGRINCRAADEVMGYLGQKLPEEVGRIYGMIHARAASWIYARDETVSETPSGFGEADVVRHGTARPYANYFAIEEQQLQFRKFGGGMSAEVQRASFVATDAALVLPYDPQRDRVLLLEQFRMGPWARGDRSPWQLEPIAGRVDPGETPDDCARREALEEAGLELQSLELIHRGYPSPGCSSEFFHVFLALTDLPDHAQGTGGVDGEHEDIRSHIMSFEAVMALLDKGQLRVMPLAMALFWLARNRDRLRAGA
ncbi:NUDIX domain-containing protein [Thalassovita aquimarina]|uniref:ADP-ribose pyrophosphatase n=1 Tax=Thalassovita aquimarina TaxID=2785917 RepID=A0ABS5HL55_9RHOB|nr:NUDIX domain-containing protein [Thalassovita aquimarina]MBR9649720.1 NUDIX domain-containing protein [Thalassovita aquimarina]